MSTCSPLEAARTAGSKIVGNTVPVEKTPIYWTGSEGRGIISTILTTRVQFITFLPHSKNGRPKQPIEINAVTWGFYKVSSLSPGIAHYIDCFDNIGAMRTYGTIIPWSDITRKMAEMSEANNPRSLCGPGKPFIRIEVVWKY